MTTELDHFKQLITKIITQTATKKTLDQIKTEAGQLPDLISMGIFQYSDQYHIRNHICLSQTILTSQADQLYRHLKNTPDLSVKKALIITLTLLDTIGSRFPEHWDSINPIPKALYDKFCIKYQPLSERLKGRFERYSIKAPLIEIALYPLNKFLSAAIPPSYHELIYLHKHLQTLKTLNLRGKSPSSAEALLCSRLITINYNELMLMDYLVGKRISELRSVFTKPEKFRILKKMRSSLKPVAVEEGIAYNKNFPVLKDAINQWIDSKEEHIKAAKERFKSLATEEQRNRQRVNVSAGVLAFMARLSKIVGIYPDSSRTDIINHMIGTYTSKKVDSITKTSFTNLWKKPSKPVARALRKILNLMLAEIQRYLDTGKLSDQPNSEEPT